MAMDVSAATSGGSPQKLGGGSPQKPGGGSPQMQVRERGAAPAGASREPGETGRAFLEAFRRLPETSYRTTASGLKVATLKEGAGKALAAGMKIKVHYTGWLADGTAFDTSLKRGEPFEMTLGAGRVIKGWEEGLTGIKPGERRQIVIPPELGYGNRPMPNIPPGSTLVFNVEAVAVEDPPPNAKGTMTVVV